MHFIEMLGYIASHTKKVTNTYAIETFGMVNNIAASSRNSVVHAHTKSMKVSEGT